MTAQTLGGMAPIAQRLRAQFERDVRSVDAVIAASERKGNVCSRWEADEEHFTASQHFELGCWLHYYADRVGKVNGFQDRVDCVRRCWEAGITDVGYKFHSVFGFGERQFDACFEMGDGDKVKDALIALAATDPNGLIAAGVKAYKWEMPADPTSKTRKAGSAPTVYIEAYACSEEATGPAYAVLTADDALRRQLLELQKLCKEHGLSEARVRRGCDFGPGAIEEDLSLNNHELVVAGDMFWFVAQPKHDDYHVETRWQSIESFVKDTSAHTDDTPLRFGEYGPEEWDEHLELAGEALRP